MSVLSSTSSSNQRLPKSRWISVLGAGFVLLILFASLLEMRLAIRGFKPSISDSANLWIQERERVDGLGTRALVLVGSSRPLLDMDLDTLRRETGLEPVQLAIDGSSFVPVLKGLADDPDVKGTVLVDFAENVLTVPAQSDAANAYEAEFEKTRLRHVPDFEDSEAHLSKLLYEHMRSYADGTRPLTALVRRVLNRTPTPQYLRMLPDREVQADYSQVTQPVFYYARVVRNLGQTVPLEGRSYRDIETDFGRRIAALQPFDNSLFLRSLPAIEDMTRTIQRHGGRVIFVTFPTSGYIRLIDDKRFPRDRFWDRFGDIVNAPHLNFEDVPDLRRFYCPDGSHLDFHDRTAFTLALIKALDLKDAGTP
ncbi:MAG: hypothetical protein ACM3ZT_10090 [Bacillota bacterium]